MNSEKLTELIKSAAIAVLFISMLLLGWWTGLFSAAREDGSAFKGIFEWIAGLGAEETDEGGDSEVSAEAASPLCIVITGGEGDHYASKYDRDELDGIYDRTGRILGDALDTAGEPSKISESEWKAALVSPGIYYEYMQPVQISVIDGWLGAEVIGLWKEMTAKSLCVEANEDSVRLLFRDEVTGLYYSADTDVSCDVVKSKISGYGNNGAYFAFEESGLETLENPYMLIILGSGAHPVISVKYPLLIESTLNDVLSFFGLSRDYGSNYTEKDGTMVFVENNFTVRISPDGTLTYKLTGPGGGEKQNAAAAVETARSIVSETAGEYCGGAEIQFLSVSSSGGGYDVYFTYCIAGGRVCINGSKYAARVTIENGTVSGMELVFRSYSETGANVSLLSELQAAAAAGGVDFFLCYSDTGESIDIVPEWISQ